MAQNDDSPFVVLTPEQAELFCPGECIRHGQTTNECPIKVAEAKLLDEIADDLPAYLVV